MKQVKKKKIKYNESLLISQAHHQNAALQAHQDLVGSIITADKNKFEANYEKARKQTENSLTKIRHIMQVPGLAMENLHRERRAKGHSVCMHVVNCYMLRQQKNKKRWEDEFEERPVRTPVHLQFLEDAFPDTCSYGVEHGWNYNHTEEADIYEYGRAAHDRKCLSTRATPIGAHMGAYGNTEPINVRFWRPPQQYMDVQKPTDEELHTREAILMKANQPGYDQGKTRNDAQVVLSRVQETEKKYAELRRPTQAYIQEEDMEMLKMATPRKSKLITPRKSKLISIQTVAGTKKAAKKFLKNKRASTKSKGKIVFPDINTPEA